MRHIFFNALVILSFIAAFCSAEALDLSNEKSLTSYSTGYQVGGDFRKQGTDIDPQIVLQGVRDALEGREPAMSHETMRETLVDLQKSVVELQKKQMEERARETLAAGKAFMAENGKKEGVTTLPSGLQYEILREGNGESPTVDDVVEVNYRGTMIDGTEFDSSDRRGRSAQFKVDKVIDGWTEALQRMKVGGKWRLVIPPDLAYGDKRVGAIKPNSTLVFDIELLAISKKTSKEPAK